VGKIDFNSLGNPAIGESDLVGRSPTSGSKTARCMKGSWQAERSPVTPLEKQMQLLLLSCRADPLIMLSIPKKEENECDASFAPPGKCNHKL